MKLRANLSLLFCTLLAGVGCGASDSDTNEGTDPGPAAEAAPAEPPGPPTYAISLSRPHAADERFQVHTVNRQQRSQVMRLGERTIREENEDHTLEMTAAVHVREVNAQGKITLVEYTIQSLVVREGEATEERAVLPAGSVVRVTRVLRTEGEGSFELVGGELSEDDTELIDPLFDTTFSATGDDAVFGSETPRRVGESWPIDSERAAQDLSKSDEMNIAADQLTGQTTLTAVEQVGGTECLRVSATMNAASIEMTGLPEGANVTSASLEARQTGAMPTDETRHGVEETGHMEMTIDMTIETPAGQATMSMTMIEDTQSEFQR